MDTRIFCKNMIKSCKAEIKVTKECIKQLEKVNPNHKYIEKYKNDIISLKNDIKCYKSALKQH